MVNLETCNECLLLEVKSKQVTVDGELKLIIQAHCGLGELMYFCIKQNNKK